MLKQGRVEEPEPDWWIGEKVVCKSCGFEGEVEEGDCKEVDFVGINAGAIVWRPIFTCPTCKCFIKLRAPRKKQAKCECSVPGPLVSTADAVGVCGACYLPLRSGGIYRC